MPPVEISFPVAALTPEQLRAEHHSFLNAVNIVHSELQLLERMIGRRGVFRESITLCERIIAVVRRSANETERAGLTEVSRPILLELFRVLDAEQFELPDGDLEIAHAVSVILQVIDEVEMRYQAARARQNVGPEQSTKAAARLVEELRACIRAAHLLDAPGVSPQAAAERVSFSTGEATAELPAAMLPIGWNLVRAAIGRQAQLDTSNRSIDVRLGDGSLCVESAGGPPSFTDGSASTGSQACDQSAYLITHQCGGVLTVEEGSGTAIVCVHLPIRDKEES